MHETELGNLLPHAFGPDDLLPPGSHTFLLSQRRGRAAARRGVCGYATA